MNWKWKIVLNTDKWYTEEDKDEDEDEVKSWTENERLYWIRINDILRRIKMRTRMKIFNQANWAGGVYPFGRKLIYRIFTGIFFWNCFPFFIFLSLLLLSIYLPFPRKIFSSISPFSNFPRSSFNLFIWGGHLPLPYFYFSLFNLFWIFRSSQS